MVLRKMRGPGVARAASGVEVDDTHHGVDTALVPIFFKTVDTAGEHLAGLYQCRFKPLFCAFRQHAGSSFSKISVRSTPVMTSPRPPDLSRRGNSGS